MPKNPTEIDFGNGFYKSSSLDFSAQRSINVFAVYAQQRGDYSRLRLQNNFGLIEWVNTLNLGAGRGWITFNGDLFSIHGTTLYKITSAKVVTTIGTISGTSHCILAENKSTIAIVDPDGKSYFYGDDISLLEINTTNFGVSGTVFTDFGQVRSVVYNDGFFVFNTDSRMFQSSPKNINFGRDFDALDFSDAEERTDDIVRMINVRGELGAMGTDSIEFFTNTGAASGFIFAPIPGASVDKGLCGIYNFVEFDNSYVYCGGSKTESNSVWRGVSGSASKISTDLIDEQLESYTESQLKTSKMFTYSKGGNFFVCLKLPDTTFVYNATASAASQTNVWTEFQSGGSSWRVNDVIKFGKTILAQDDVDGRIGEIVDTDFSEYGVKKYHEVTSGYTHDFFRRIINSYVQLIMQSGTSVSQTEIDGIMLQISDDGGKSFQDIYSIPLGNPGDIDTAFIWRQLGSFANSRLFRLHITTSAKLSMLALLGNFRKAGQ